MLEPLTGRLTLLFTDIEGSTRLLHERGADYPKLLAHHREVVRAALTEHRGTEVDTQGDAFFAVFDDAADAVAAAQATLAGLRDGPIRVRIGMHTGTALWTGEGYVGPDVHLAARVCSAAHGGQVLLSETTRQIVGDRQTTDLGQHRLKDIPEAVRLYQVGTGSFPPLRTLHATNLPVQPTSLIGRDQMQAELIDLLAEGGPRLITLVGPGGIGKTSLATAVAAELVPAIPSGVFFVDLTRVRDPGLVGQAIAETIGAKGDLADHIGQKAMFLVLDNMEHVLAAGPDVAQLMGRCPNLRLLVTSRVHLRLRGEHEYALDVLPEDAAVALFVERARAVDPSVQTDPAVTEICRRLDGLPLAIELAASRLGALSAAELLQRLDRRLALLTGGPLDLPDRQQTLRATVAWSVDLLPPAPRTLFARLAVFVGGWTLDAAEAICDADLDDLAVLVEHSLVQRTANRYGMLETIREFSTEEFAVAPDASDLPARHTGYYVDICRTAAASLDIGYEGEFLPGIRADLPNIRAALEWLRAHADGNGLSVVVLALWFYWLTTGATEEGELWIQAALDLSEKADSPERAWLLGILGEFPRFSGDPRRAISIKLSSLRMARHVGHDGMAAAILADLTSLHANIGEFDAARRFGEEALQLREAGAMQRRGAKEQGIAHALHGLAEVAMKSGDPLEAERMMRKADELEAPSNAPEEDRILTTFMLEESVRRQGRFDEARALAEDVLARAIKIDFQMAVLESLVALAAIRSRDDVDAAATLLGAVDALLERVHLVPFDADDHRRTIGRVRTALGEEAYEVATRHGRHLTEKELMSLARRQLRT